MGTQLYQLQQMKDSGFGKSLEPQIPQRMITLTTLIPQRMITLKTQKWLSAIFILTSAKNVPVKIYGIGIDVQL